MLPIFLKDCYKKCVNVCLKIILTRFYVAKRPHESYKSATYIFIQCLKKASDLVHDGFPYKSPANMCPKVWTGAIIVLYCTPNHGKVIVLEKYLILGCTRGKCFTITCRFKSLVLGKLDPPLFVNLPLMDKLGTSCNLE